MSEMNIKVQRREATGKSATHFVTTLECNACHNTTVWTPVRFTHSSPNYPGDHRQAPTCNACHLGNSQVMTWRFPAYQPDCAGCHADDFDPGEHNGSVSEYRNCAGPCHNGRTGEHSVNRTGW